MIVARDGNFLLIVCTCMASAVIYGILQDQITVRLCIEYFTVGHFPILGDQHPTILAILWGFVATMAGGSILSGSLLRLPQMLDLDRSLQHSRSVHNWQHGCLCHRCRISGTLSSFIQNCRIYWSRKFRRTTRQDSLPMPSCLTPAIWLDLLEAFSW